MTSTVPKPKTDSHARVAELEARLAVIEEVTTALEKQLDLEAVAELVGERLHASFPVADLFMALFDARTNMISFPYEVAAGARQHTEPIPAESGLTAKVIRTGRPLLIRTQNEAKRHHAIQFGEPTASWMGVPISAAGDVIGVLAMESDAENAFGDNDLRLLASLAATTGIALRNARLFAETTQRNAELAVINEIGEALAQQLDFHGIIDAVGERIRAIFQTRTAVITLHDAATNNLATPYSIDQGERLSPPDRPLGGLAGEVIQTRRPLRLGSNEASQALHAVIWGTDDAESWLGVPIIAGERALGVISLERLPKNAFSESDERLLATIASNLGVALENARLFDETKRLLTETNERAAELAIINSVQQGLAAKLDMQSMYELVGDKIQEIFDAQVMAIALYDRATLTSRYPYAIERGVRFPEFTGAFSHVTHLLMKEKQALLIPDMVAWQAEQNVVIGVIEGEPMRSALYVPLMRGDEVFGALSLQNGDRTDAYSEADARLLSTLAASLSVALENARLFGETQRLLTETDERAAELAIINSVQQGLASKLDMQSMYELVGDKIQETFDAQEADIALYNLETNTLHYVYGVERGVRLAPQDRDIPFGPFTRRVAASREPLLINDVETWTQESGEQASVPAGEPTKSVLFAPLIAGTNLRGHISLQNIDRTNAFTDADVRLLTTLASSLAVALENARLFGETERLLTETNERAAELAIINSVQQGLAAKLDMQSMYELVGEKIQEIFDAQVVDIAVIDESASTMSFAYGIERGQRLEGGTYALMGPRRYVVESREPLLINENIMSRVRELGQEGALEGEIPKAGLWVPLTRGDAVHGIISLQNLDRENAFGESDVRLLTTLAGSLSVALENARLFAETQRLLTETNERAAELAIINSVQQGLAAKLDMQSMYELVGDKIREIFDAQVVDIGIFDFEHELTRFPYTIERGARFPDEPSKFSANTRWFLERAAPLVIDDVASWSKEMGHSWTVIGEPSKSMVMVPLVSAGQLFGRISLQNLDRTHAFSEADVRLLTTLASSLSVALDNARLVAETRQRAAELAIVNDVGQAAASQLDLSLLMALVGDKMAETFRADILYIALYDATTRTIDFPYYSENGERQGNGSDCVRRGPHVAHHPYASAPTHESGRPIRRARREGHRARRSFIPGRADAAGRRGDRRDQRPEQHGGRTLRRSGGRPARDARREHRFGNSQCAAVQRVAGARHGDGRAG